MRCALFVVLPLALVALVGCGGEKPSEVSGTVLMDGAPLPEGEILFLAVDNSKSPEAAPIKNGKYSLTVSPGAKKVQIKASRPSSAKSDPAMGVPPQESMIGPEYNEKSTLTADIKPGKNEGVDFKVKALPKKK